MSRADKHRALRLFLYLRVVGHTPAQRAAANYFELAAMLTKEYEELPRDVRRTGRLLGRATDSCGGLESGLSIFAKCRRIHIADNSQNQVPEVPGQEAEQAQKHLANQRGCGSILLLL